MSINYSPKIFLVDDDSYCQALYTEELQKLGFDHVICFETGAELLDNLSQNPDLILLDYNLEDMKGLELLAKIKAFNPHIFVVIISGQSDMEITVRLLNNGAFDYIIKDEFETTKIATLIDKWLSATEMNEKLKSQEGIYPSEKFLRVITEAQEKVRMEISDELHDNVNQLLGASKLYMDIAYRDDENRLSMIEESKKIINDAIVEVSKLSRSLKLNLLQNNSLTSDINLLIDRLKKQNSFNLSTFISIDQLNKSMNIEIQNEIFRIVQEQINNISKYAKASSVYIGLFIQDKKLIMEVKDDGIGFDLGKAKRGLGLNNIFKRISNINGTCSLNTKPGNGCDWKIDIPLENNNFDY